MIITTSTKCLPDSQTWRFYYYAGTDRIAVRVRPASGTEAVYYLFADHRPFRCAPGVLRSSMSEDRKGNRSPI